MSFLQDNHEYLQQDPRDIPSNISLWRTKMTAATNFTQTESTEEKKTLYPPLPKNEYKVKWPKKHS